MEFPQPPTWREALEARAVHPGAVAIWGGTDVMVEMNFARTRPEALLDLTCVDELSRWSAEDGWLRIGAGVSYTCVIDELGASLPGLAMASRTVGSPQIRNRGTVGGNLGSASPAGDALPPLDASGAEVELASVTSTVRASTVAWSTSGRGSCSTAGRTRRRRQRSARTPRRSRSGRTTCRDGLRGIGEPPTISSTPAIVAALRAATGRPLTRVPVRPDDMVGL